jgi:hypothetical protein
VRFQEPKLPEKKKGDNLVEPPDYLVLHRPAENHCDKRNHRHGTGKQFQLTKEEHLKKPKWVKA